MGSLLTSLKSTLVVIVSRIVTFEKITRCYCFTNGGGLKKILQSSAFIARFDKISYSIQHCHDWGRVLNPSLNWYKSHPSLVLREVLCHVYCEQLRTYRQRYHGTTSYPYSHIPISHLLTLQKASIHIYPFFCLHSPVKSKPDNHDSFWERSSKNRTCLSVKWYFSLCVW